MSVATCTTSPTSADRRASDSLVQGVSLLLGLTAVQRVVGFLRGLVFCSCLTPAALGHWDVAFSFLMLAGPVVVLSVPGAFGRLAGDYQARGQLRWFVARCGGLVALLATAALVTMLTATRPVAEVLFGDTTQGPLVLHLAACLLLVVANNFFIELFSALRYQRWVSGLQLVHTLAFIAASAVTLWLDPNDVAVVVDCYAFASLLAVGCSLPLFRQLWIEAPSTRAAEPAVSFWSVLLPIALSIWANNWLAGMFGVVDRTLIVHASGLDASTAAAQLGVYHGARQLPWLVLMLANLLAGLLVPHLAHELRTSGIAAVAQRLQRVVTATGVALLAASLTILLVTPTLFERLFPDKFTGALALLPVVMGTCALASLTCLVRVYLWIDDRPLWPCLAYVAGLAASLVGNQLFSGAAVERVVWSTWLGNVVALVVILALCQRRGWRGRAGLWATVAMLLVIPLGPLATSAAMLAAVWLWTTTDWFLSHTSQQHWRQVASAALVRLSLFTRRKLLTGNSRPLNPQE